MSLRAKILAAIVPLIATPAALLAWLAHGVLTADARARISAQADTVIDQARLLLVHEAEVASASAALMARNDLVERYLLTDNELDRYMIMQPPLLRLFRDFQRIFPQYRDIWLLRADGTEDTHLGQVGHHSRGEGRLPVALLERLVVAPERGLHMLRVDQASRRLNLLSAEPVRLVDRTRSDVGAPPETRGYIAISTLLDDAAHLPRHLPENGLGTFFVVDRAGRVVAHPDIDRIGTTIRPWTALSAAEAVGPLEIELGNGDMIRVGSLGYGLYAAVAVPHASLIASGHRIGLMIAFAALLAVFLSSGALALMLERLVVRPVSRLALAAEEIGKGNLRARPEGGGSAELEELGLAFRRMGENLRSAADRAHQLAYHDQLTGLPNRVMLLEQLDAAIATARRHDQMLAVVFLDLDNFKQVNDSLGHGQGDRLLVVVADILRGCLRTEDLVARSEAYAGDGIVARLGGDEFTILLPAIRKPCDARHVAERILGALEQPIAVGAHEHTLGASIGITLFPEDGDDAATLLKNADVAMYHAKGKGKNNFQYYSSDMNARVALRMTLEHRLRNAIDDDEVYLEYQPIVDTDSNILVGMEALARWSDPQLGAISAQEIIRVAEESGLIAKLGAWVLHRACLDLNRLGADVPRDFFVSVNASPIQLNRGDFVQTLCAALATQELAPERLQIEITESAVLELSREAASEIEQLSRLGVRVLLDDFGTGYSSLGQLQDLPIHGMKIDRCFVAAIAEPEERHPVVAAIVELARVLDLTVIAEGVETAAQRAFLSRHGCRLMQGPMFSPPAPPTTIAKYVGKQGAAAA